MLGWNRQAAAGRPKPDNLRGICGDASIDDSREIFDTLHTGGDRWRETIRGRLSVPIDILGGRVCNILPFRRPPVRADGICDRHSKQRRHSDESVVGCDHERITMSETIFQKYGGFPALSGVVLTFYDKALDSDQIGDFFDEIDMSRLVDHQTKFISSLLGGPASFADERLKHLHSRLDISDQDFDEMAKLLVEALEEHGFESADCDAVAHEIESRRSYIVKRGAG